MQLLLDTHTFLWFTQGDARLSQTARTLIEDVNNVNLVSVASIWEMAIKVGLGKLAVAQPFTAQLINNELRKYSFVLHPITVDHAVRVASLPLHPDHRDPFDRLLIATATVDGMPIISADSKFDSYPGVQRLF